MRKTVKNCSKVAILLTALTVSGCGAGHGNAGIAGFASVKEGLHVNNGVHGKKRGEACIKNILGLFSFGDASIEEAKRNGNITNVATVDRKLFGWNYYLSYAKVCTVVEGN